LTGWRSTIRATRPTPIQGQRTRSFLSRPSSHSRTLTIVRSLQADNELGFLRMDSPRSRLLPQAQVAPAGMDVTAAQSDRRTPLGCNRVRDLGKVETSIFAPDVMGATCLAHPARPALPRRQESAHGRCTERLGQRSRRSVVLLLLARSHSCLRRLEVGECFGDLCAGAAGP